MALLGACPRCGASPSIPGMFLGFGPGPRALECRCGGWASTTVLYRLIWNVLSTWKYLFLGLLVGFKAYGASWALAAGGAFVIGGLASVFLIGPVTLGVETLNKALGVRDEGDALVERTAREAAAPPKARSGPLAECSGCARSFNASFATCPFCGKTR